MSTALTVLNALLVTCRAYNSGLTFDANNSALNDWAVLDAANTEYSLIVETGNIDEGDDLERRGSEGLVIERHLPKVYIAKKIGTGAEGYSAAINGVQSHVEGVKDYIRSHDRLGNTSVIASAQSIKTSESLDVLKKNQGSPTHVMQRIDMRIWTESDAPDEDEGGW